MSSTDLQLIETYKKSPSPNLLSVKRTALRALAYYNMNPYPIFGFTDWKTEDRGPLPKCLPFIPNIINRLTKWLFKKPPKITTTNKKAEEFIIKPFEKLHAKLIKAARDSMIEGSITLRFIVDTEAKTTRFTFLSTLDNVRFIYDPHDADKVLVAYVHYPYYDANKGEYMMFREAWTPTTYVTFKPQPVKFISVKFNEVFQYGQVAYIQDADKPIAPEEYEKWEIDKTATNVLGFIPLIQIKDKEGDTQYGEGVFWKVTHIFDRVNLIYHLMDRSNQFDSEPTVVYIDASLDSHDNITFSPGGAQEIKTDSSEEGSNRQAKVQLVEPAGRLRIHMESHARDLRKQVNDYTGTVEIANEELSNKGNFTQSVLNQIYAPIIESTDARRFNWELNLESFLCQCAKSVDKIFNLDWKASDYFDVSWPEYFITPEAEKGLMVDRLIKQENHGLYTKERVIKELAAMDGIADVEEFLKELKDYKPEIKNEVAAEMAEQNQSEPDGDEKINQAQSVNQRKPKGKGEPASE